MILQNQKTGATIDTGKISLRTLVDHLLAKGYTGNANMYELSNTRAYSKSGDSWHSYKVYASKDGKILVKQHFLHEIDSKGNQNAILLTTVAYEEKALTRFSVKNIVVQLNMGVIEDLELTEDRYLENIKDQVYNSTGISKCDVPCEAANQVPQVVQPMQPLANPALAYMGYPGYVIPPIPQPMTQPTAQQVMVAQPGFPINQPIQTTMKTAIENQPETISVLGTKLELSAKDMCPHVNVATGQSVLELKKHHSTGETYAHCQICGAIWVDKPVTAETVKEAWYVIKSTIEFLKSHKRLTHQELKDLIATDLNVFGLDMEVARAQGRTDYPKPFCTMYQEKAATKEIKQDTTNESKQPDNSSK